MAMSSHACSSFDDFHGSCGILVAEHGTESIPLNRAATRNSLQRTAFPGLEVTVKDSPSDTGIVTDRVRELIRRIGVVSAILKDKVKWQP